jgi:hypothetical protein
MPMMLDLFSGLGGQSEAFLQDGWDVLRIDNNPLLSGVPRTVMMNIEHLHPTNSYGHIDYVHASPPCDEFSMAYNAKRPNHLRESPDREYLPNMKPLMESIRIINAIQPRYWSIENVRGACKYFEPFLGKPHLVKGAYVYWGNFPLFDPQKVTIETKAAKDKRHSALRSNHRACIDFNISKAFLEAMKSQRTLFDY